MPASQGRCRAQLRRPGIQPIGHCVFSSSRRNLLQCHPRIGSTLPLRIPECAAEAWAKATVEWTARSVIRVQPPLADVRFLLRAEQLPRDSRSQQLLQRPESLLLTKERQKRGLRSQSPKNRSAGRIAILQNRQRPSIRLLMQVRQHNKASGSAAKQLGGLAESMPAPKVSLAADNLHTAGCWRKKLFRRQEKVIRALDCSTTLSAEQFGRSAEPGLLPAKAITRRRLV